MPVLLMKLAAFGSLVLEYPVSRTVLPILSTEYAVRKSILRAVQFPLGLKASESKALSHSSSTGQRVHLLVSGVITTVTLASSLIWLIVWNFSQAGPA